MAHNQTRYETAISRNIGWVTRNEQATLQNKRIAIAGMGGVGGSHLLTLTRMGLGSFHIADFDTFELGNLNRQAGACMSSLDHAKVDVLATMALDINPDLHLQRFPDGVTQENVRLFLEGVDLYVDGLDFFAIKARRNVFATCCELGIPSITAAPLGMGVAVLTFMPGQMTFEEYFRMEGHCETEQLRRFLKGLAPAGIQNEYLVDPSTIDLIGHKGPSTAMACDLCAGVAGSIAVKILIQRGNVLAAPHGLQFDIFLNKCVQTCWRPWDEQNPDDPLRNV